MSTSVLVEMTPQMLDVMERLCKLSEEVHSEVVGYSHASDCFCTRGGVWHEQDGVMRNRYWCHEGQTVDFIEEAVRYALAAAKI